MIHVIEEKTHPELEPWAVWTDTDGGEFDGRCIGTGKTRGQALADALIELDKEVYWVRCLLNEEKPDGACVEDGCNEPCYVGSYCLKHAEKHVPY